MMTIKSWHVKHHGRKKDEVEQRIRKLYKTKLSLCFSFRIMVVGRADVCAYDNVSKGVSLPNTIRCVPSGALKI
jgi:hypothetical protein